MRNSKSSKMSANGNWSKAMVSRRVEIRRNKAASEVGNCGRFARLGKF